MYAGMIGSRGYREFRSGARLARVLIGIGEAEMKLEDAILVQRLLTQVDDCLRVARGHLGDEHGVLAKAR